MFSNREVLTFQLGNYANYIGSHWWNIQESCFTYDPTEKSEINHDVMFREGLNYKRQTTYTPRLLLVDLDGSLKHMSREGSLYGNVVNRIDEETDEKSMEELKNEFAWDEKNIDVITEPKLPKHEFQVDIENSDVNIDEKDYNMSETVDSWTDYLFTRFHPRTVNLIKKHKYSPNKHNFDTFSTGVDIWNSKDFEDEFCDKIRQYIEECDCAQGFQILFDCHDGFSGLAAQCSEHLHDEYSKACFMIPIYPPKNILFENADLIMSDSIRVINSALTFSHLIQQCSMITPLCTPNKIWRQLGSQRKLHNVNYKADNLYQTSAILASFIDTLSLRYRLKNALQSSSLPGLCNDMTNYGRKLTAAAISMPFPMKYDVDLIDCLDKFEGNLFTQLSPNCNIGTNYVVQSLSVRGISHDRLKRPLKQAQDQIKMAAYRCESVSQMFQLYLQCANHASLAHVSAIQAPMPTKCPFPREIFDASLNNKGFSNDYLRDPEDRIQSIPIIASIQSSSDIGDTLESLHREANRLKISKMHRYKESGLEEEDFVTALENLLLFRENYDDNMKL